MEAMAPPKHGESMQGEAVALNQMVGGCPLFHHESQSSRTKGSSSKVLLEHKEVKGDLNVNPAKEFQNARVGRSNVNSDLEFQDSKEVLHPGSLAASIAVSKSAPTTSMNSTSSTRLIQQHASQYSASRGSHQVLDPEIDTGAISAADLIEDAKFYQDTALGYQDAYETLHIQQELQHRYTQQA